MVATTVLANAPRPPRLLESSAQHGETMNRVAPIPIVAERDA